jgi:hypothetical protein
MCGKFATGVNDTCGKLPPVSTTPAANFATSSPCVVDTGIKFATGVNDAVANCHQYQRHWRQIMGTISGCRHLKVNLKVKIYIYFSSIIQRWPNKIIKIFLIEDFFHLPPVSLTLVANLELRISPRISEKFETVLMEYSGTGGKLIHEKNQKQKIS